MQEREKVTRRRVARRLAAQRGMTLIEIMIVVIIMAMIATGVAVAVVPAMERSRIKTAITDSAAVQSAVQMYLAENPGKCPSVEDLKSEKYLQKGKRTTDPWDKEFVINCVESDDPEVYSMGPDMQEGGCDPGKHGDDGCSSGE
ncbi:MAG: prepilin-type N-terminal cleavage/methylation domain-containing protein [Deltaproteobacteria bacterium]|nr:prepilin-type N-terminal cleavage/methylation domain-containing protein [Deltaproteobacteria bacterium]